MPHSIATVASLRFQFSSISTAQKATNKQKYGTVVASVSKPSAITSKNTTLPRIDSGTSHVV